jgi:hypothetical protein
VIHAAVTWFMVGLIWMVQTVHYPLLHRVPAAGFVAYERGHTGRMGGLLAIPAGAEVATAAALVWARPDGVGLGLVLVAGALLAVVWTMTALVQAPLHGRLTWGFDPDLIRRLVTSNWWRTGAWTLRGILVAAMLLS